MEILLTCTAGILVACGIYGMMREGMVQVILGIMLLGHGANLMIFCMGKLVHAGAPLIPQGQKQLLTEVSDPLPQALVLTAIVIGFGITAFILSLFYRSYQVIGSHRMDDFSNRDDEVK